MTAYPSPFDSFIQHLYNIIPYYIRTVEAFGPPLQDANRQASLGQRKTEGET